MVANASCKRGAVAVIIIAVVLLFSLTASACAKTVRVPDLSGKSLDEASKLLRDNRLVIGSVSETYHKTVPEGMVVSQSTEPGQKVEAGAAVNFAVSKGPSPEMTAVPSVVGMTSAQAYKRLVSSNLSTGYVYRTANPQPEGTVIYQQPESGSSVPIGSKVNLTVSSGPDSPYAYMKRVKFKVNSTYDGPLTAWVKVLDDRGLVTVYSAQHRNGDIVEIDIWVHGVCKEIVEAVVGPKGHWNHPSTVK